MSSPVIEQIVSVLNLLIDDNEAREGELSKACLNDRCASID